MPINEKRVISSFNFIDKDSIKDMSPDEKEALVNAYKKECLMAASDTQDLIDFMTEVVLTVKQTPINVDLSKLETAITGVAISLPEDDPTVLDYSETGQPELEQPEQDEV